MPKPMYVWTGTAWVSVASEVESLATYATQSYADAQPGMKLVVPTSIAVGSGSGSVSTSGAVTFSAASSVSLNGCFNSTYDHYRVVAQIATATGGSYSLRMRTSGTDNTNSNYQRSTIFNYGTTTGAETALTTSWNLGDGSTNAITSITLDMFNPNKSEQTHILFRGLTDQAAGYVNRSSGLWFTTTTVFDGLTFYAAGNVTGNIRVYGLKN